MQEVRETITRLVDEGHLESVDDAIGRTLGDIFRDLERGNCVVYWGFWSSEELDSVID